MRRRVTREAVPEMPVHLREFDPVAWGWSGPHYVDGYIVSGYHAAWLRWLGARQAWCDEPRCVVTSGAPRRSGARRQSAG